MVASSTIKSVLYAAVAFACFGTVTAAPRGLLNAREPTRVVARNYTTNAQRLRDGLSPFPPRSLFPSKSGVVARDATVSILPLPPVQCIKVQRKGTGNVLGYISTDYVGQLTQSFAVGPKNKCLQVNIPSVTTGTFDLVITSAAANDNRRWLGLATGIFKYALPVQAAQSSSSIFGQNSNAVLGTPASQSQVWSRTGATGALGLWRSSESSINVLPTYMRPTSTALHFVTDLSWTTETPGSFEVDLYFADA